MCILSCYSRRLKNASLASTSITEQKDSSNRALYSRCNIIMYRFKLLTMRSPAFAFILLTLITAPVNAEKFASIIIDDIGNNLKHGQDIIKLPYALTVAILPETAHAITLARLAKKNQKEVMLHMPMQSVAHHKLSPGTLKLHMSQSQFKQQLQLNLNAVPYVRGVNNHMGSLITRHPGHMSLLMKALSQRGDLYFIDSRTSSKTVAEKMATEYSIPNMARDIFLDPDFKASTLRRQFDRFIKIINQRGYALAIAHPHPETIKFLRNHLAELNQHGITLLPVSELIYYTNQKHKKQENNYVACASTSCPGL